MNHLSVGFAVATLIAAPAEAAVYWNAGVRSKDVSVCFVGNAMSARPARVAQILDDIHEYELAANLHFDFLGTCPASQPQADGDDWFDGDIRVVIPNIDVSGLGVVPGTGCQLYGGADNYNGGNDEWYSWASAPQDLDVARPCLYNLKLGDDPWSGTPYRNHSLHEFGHALGLAHEHARGDATCPGPGNYVVGYLTDYDIDSVMGYSFPECGALGNYSNSGLSAKDKLGIRILYPEDGLPAAIVGKRLVRTGESVNLTFGWRAEGAYATFVVSNATWRIDGAIASHALDFQHVFSVAGQYLISLEVVDFLGRTHAGQVAVKVLPPDASRAILSASNSIVSELLGKEFSIFYGGFDDRFD